MLILRPTNFLQGPFGLTTRLVVWQSWYVGLSTLRVSAGSNPTYHDCHTTSIDHSSQTKGYYPCLNPNVFNPTDLNAEDWMAASASLGMREIIITAHHEGGFALWPSKFTPYSVAASSWKGGKGDVLREFADAANKWGVKIGYYLNVQDDGYMASVANYSDTEFIRRQIGMVTEVLTQYGPVNRFWSEQSPPPPAWCPRRGGKKPSRDSGRSQPGGREWREWAVFGRPLAGWAASLKARDSSNDCAHGCVHVGLTGPQTSVGTRPSCGPRSTRPSGPSRSVPHRGSFQRR